MGLSVQMTMRNNSVEVGVFPTGNTVIKGVPRGMGKQVSTTGDVRKIARDSNVSDSDVNGELILAVRNPVGNREYWLSKEYRGMSGVQKMAQEGRSVLSRMSQAVNDTVKDIDAAERAGKQAADALTSASSELKKHFKVLNEWEKFASMYTNSQPEARDDLKLTQVRSSISTANALIRTASNAIRGVPEYRSISDLNSIQSSLSSLRSESDKKKVGTQLVQIQKRIQIDADTATRISAQQDQKKLQETRRAMDIAGKAMGFKFSEVRLTF